MSWLSRLLRGRGQARRESEDSYEWKNRELGLYFKPQPNDSAWKAITPRLAELMQQGFLEIYRLGELEDFTDTNDLPTHVNNTISEVANRVSEPNDMNPAFIILVTLQYVDADKVLRQSYRSRWVSMMVARSQFAPPPESYVTYIKAQYFSSNE